MVCEALSLHYVAAIESGDGEFGSKLELDGDLRLKSTATCWMSFRLRSNE